MNVQLLLALYLLMNVCANIENKLIIDYFGYKRAPSVAGYSCNIDKDDLLLIKHFSRNGIAAAIRKLNNESGFHLLANANYWKLGIFLDIRCYNEQSITSLFVEASVYGMFDELRYWLILGADLASVLQIIDDRAFGLSTDFVIAIPSGSENHKLYDTYNAFKDRGGKLNITFLGDWSRKHRLNVSLTMDKFTRRSNLHRLLLKTVTFKSLHRSNDMPLDEYLNDYTHPTQDGLSKFGFQILNHLADIYNFKLEVFETSLWKSSDTIGPVAGALVNHSADITASPLSISISRTYIIKFVHQDYPLKTCFMFLNPQPTSVKVKEILRPFTDQIWYLMILFLSVSITTYAMILHFEGIDTRITRFSNSFLINIGSLCQQGTDMKMNRISSRIAFFSIMIFGLLMYNYYSASVVSARLDEPIIKINDSLNELGKLHLKMSSEPMIYFDFFLKQPDWDKRSFYQNYWLKLPKADRFMEPEVGMQLVKRGGFAYHTHAEKGYELLEKTFDNREICELTEVHLAGPWMNAFAVPLNSTLVEIARVGLTKISEVGLRRRQVSRWQYRKPHCRKDVLSASSINIYEFAPHLLLLTFGTMLAIAVCIVEIVIAYHRTNFTTKFKSKWKSVLGLYKSSLGVYKQ